MAPAAEDWSGTIVDLRPLGARVSTPIHRRTFRHPQAPNEKTLGAIVAVAGFAFWAYSMYMRRRTKRKAVHLEDELRRANAERDANRTK